MAVPAVPALSQAIYSLGQTIVVTIPSPDPALYYTASWALSNGAGQGLGATDAPVPSGAGTPQRPVAPGATVVSVATGAPNRDWARFFSVTLRTWTAAPFSGSGSNLVGERTVTAEIFSSASPTITSLGLSDGNTAVTAASIGAYVQGLSTLKWNFAATPGAGATIASSKLEISGVTYPASTGETPPLSATGTISIKGTVTNSRGQTATRTETINVLAYQAPKITSLLAFRATSGGVADDNGTYVRMSFTAAISALTVGTQKNRSTYTLRTRPRGTTTWTTRSSASNSTSLTPAATVTPSGFPTGAAYEVRVDVTDLFGATAAVTFVSKGGVLMDWGEGTLGIGKMWEQGTLDVFGDIYQGAGTSRRVLDARDFATNAEVIAGTSTSKLITPSGLASWVSDRDSGWLPLTGSAVNGFSQNPSAPVGRRRIGDVVYLRGDFYRSTAPGTTAALAAWSGGLPEGFRPASGYGVATIPFWDLYFEIPTSGEIRISSSVARTSGVGYQITAVNYIAT